MSKWTQDPTYPRIIIDEDRQAICEILGDSARQAAAFTCLIAEAPAMAAMLERLSVIIHNCEVAGVALSDEDDEAWGEATALLARLEADK